MSRIILLVIFLIGLTGAARSDFQSLAGNTLICSPGSGHPVFYIIYVTEKRVMTYHTNDPSKPSKTGIIYEFGKKYSGNSAGNSYTTTAKRSDEIIDLTTLITNRTCGICDGKTLMQRESIVISYTAGTWTVLLDYQQWFPDGTRATVPFGRDVYECKQVPGRVGVGQ